MDTRITPHYGVRVISNRERHSIVVREDGGGGGYALSGSDGAGDLAFILAGSYLGAALGWFAGMMLVAWVWP